MELKKVSISLDFKNFPRAARMYRLPKQVILEVIRRVGIRDMEEGIPASLGVKVRRGDYERIYPPEDPIFLEKSYLQMLGRFTEPENLVSKYEEPDLVEKAIEYLMKGKISEWNSLRRSIPEVDLSGAYLPGKDFSEADFTHVDFLGAVLPRAIFANTSLTSTCFVRADLQGAKIMDIELRKTFFARTILTGAEFRNVKFSNTLFNRVNFEGVKIEAKLKDNFLKGTARYNTSNIDKIIWT